MPLQTLLHAFVVSADHRTTYSGSLCNSVAAVLLQDIVQKPFARLTYTDAVELLLKAKVKFEFPVKWGSDLQSEHERYLTEQEFDGTPLFVTDYPKDIKVMGNFCHLAEDIICREPASNLHVTCNQSAPVSITSQAIALQVLVRQVFHLCLHGS